MIRTYRSAQASDSHTYHVHLGRQERSLPVYLRIVETCTQIFLARHDVAQALSETRDTTRTEVEG
eukprot:5914276-Pleurochrysis_carterae.AAC.3